MTCFLDSNIINTFFVFIYPIEDVIEDISIVWFSKIILEDMLTVYFQKH